MHKKYLTFDYVNKHHERQISIFFIHSDYFNSI